jgi:hypothetical protein
MSYPRVIALQNYPIINKRNTTVFTYLYLILTVLIDKD